MIPDYPSSWAAAQLTELGVWMGGGTPSKAEPTFWTEGEVPWLSPKDMGPRELQRTQDKVASVVLERTNVKLVAGPSVAVVVRSGILERRFPVALVPFDTTLNQDMKAVVPAVGVSASWLRYALMASESRILRDCRKAGTTVASIETSRLLGLEVAVPPTDEQVRIAELLDKQFTMLDAVEKSRTVVAARIDALEGSLRRAAIRGALAVNHEPAPQRGEVLGRREPRASSTSTPPSACPVEFPDEWALVSLSDLAWDIDYGTSTKCEYDGAGLPVLRIPNVVDGGVAAEDMKHAVDTTVDLSNSVVLPGDLLVVRTNGSKELIGRAAVVPEQETPTAFASYLIRCRLLTEVVEPAWVALVLSSPHWRTILEQRAASTAGQHNLSIAKLSDIPIPLPSLETQHAVLETFTSQLGQVRALRTALQTQSKMAAALQQSLLAAALAGRVVEQNPEDEPAELLLKRIAEDRENAVTAAGKRKKHTVRRPRTPRAPRIEETSA